MNARNLGRFFFVVAVGCSSGCSSAKKEPQLEPVVSAAPVPTAAPTAEPTAEPVSSVQAPPASTLPPPSGRTPLVFSKPDKITDSFGATPAAKLELTKEGAIFRIPEYALNDGMLLTFMLDAKGKKGKGGAGSVYRLLAQVPPAESATQVQSKGPKFLLILPAAKVATPNLAIGEPKKDDKGKESIEWTVIAPTKTEGDKVTFELEGFTNPFLHITSEAPSAPKAPAP